MMRQKTGKADEFKGTVLRWKRLNHAWICGEEKPKKSEEKTEGD